MTDQPNQIKYYVFRDEALVYHDEARFAETSLFNVLSYPERPLQSVVAATSEDLRPAMRRDFDRFRIHWCQAYETQVEGRIRGPQF